MAAWPFIFSTKKHNNNLSENIATEFQRRKKLFDKSLGHDFQNHSKKHNYFQKGIRTCVKKSPNINHIAGCEECLKICKRQLLLHFIWALSNLDYNKIASQG